METFGKSREDLGTDWMQRLGRQCSVPGRVMPCSQIEDSEGGVQKDRDNGRRNTNSICLLSLKNLYYLSGDFIDPVMYTLGIQGRGLGGRNKFRIHDCSKEMMEKLTRSNVQLRKKNVPSNNITIKRMGRGRRKSQRSHGKTGSR